MFEIFAYQNSESLFGIFNAVAALMGSPTYASAIAAVAFCGFVAAALAYAFAPEKLQGWKWIATVVLVYSVLFVPRVEVGIVDKTGGAPVKVVANVPLGMALFGGLTSSIGNTLTELFETAFQAIPGPGGLSSDFAYQKNGLLFGSRLIRDTRAVVIRDPNLRTDLINFVHNCTMYDLIDGTLDPANFSTSSDVWSLMGSPNPARFTSLTTSSGITNATCPQAYFNLSSRLPSEVNSIQGTLALQLNPTLPTAVANSVIAGQIEQAYLRNQIATSASSAADLIRQNAVINAINDASDVTGQKINDPASMILAVGRAQAVAQQNAAWVNGGKIAEQALPIVRNVVEAMTYALFPLFVLLLFLTSGRETAVALKSYVVVLIWIQLWPPLFAILNYMATIFAQYDLAAAAQTSLGNRALSLQTSSSIFSNAVSAEAVVGYLVASIPFLAWAAMKRMETFGTVVAGGLSGLQSSLSAATASAAVGNVGLGNVTMDQRVISPSTSSAWVARSQDLSGDWHTLDSTGRLAVSKLQNEGFASQQVSVRISEAQVAESSRLAESARSESVVANTELSASLTEVYSRGMSKLHGARESVGTSSSSFDEAGQALDKLDQIVNSVAKRTGASQSQVAQVAFGASAQFGVGAPNLSPLQARIQGGGSADKHYAAGASTEQLHVLTALTEEQIGEFKRFGDRATRDKAFTQLLAKDEREASEISSRLSSQSSRLARAEATYLERKAFAERISSLHESGVAVSIDLARNPHNVELFRRLTQDYGDSTAALVLLESELARQALKPNRVIDYGGSALPISFDDVRDSKFAEPASDIESLARQNKRRAESNFNRAAAIGIQEPNASTNLRSEIAAAGQHITQEVRTAQRDLPDTIDVSSDENGTLKSSSSLLKRAAKQVAADASATGENAKEVLKGLLQKR